MLTRSQTHLPKPTPRTRTRGAKNPLNENFSWRDTGANSGFESVSPTPVREKVVHHYDGSYGSVVARYFDAELGRFISRDPLGYVDGMSMYRGYFVPNHLDPEGTILGHIIRFLSRLLKPKPRVNPPTPRPPKKKPPKKDPLDEGVWTCTFNCPSPCNDQIIRNHMGVRKHNPCKKIFQHVCTRLVYCEKEETLKEQIYTVTCSLINAVFTGGKKK